MSAEVAVADNLVRFPAERRGRPTLALMRELAPDVRDVRDIVDAFHLADPAPPARERAEADVAACVRDLDAGDAAGVAAALSGVLTPLVVAAVRVCWAARDASRPASRRGCAWRAPRRRERAGAPGYARGPRRPTRRGPVAARRPRAGPEGRGRRPGPRRRPA